MKNRLQWFILVLVSILILAQGKTTSGDTGDMALGLKVGTLGVGAEMTVGLSGPT